MKRRFSLQLVVFLAASLCFLTSAFAEDKERYFEIGIGGGTNLLQSLDTKQVIITPAMNWEIKGAKSLWFRLEGDIELIDDDRRLTFVVGAAPMVRLFLSEDGNRPKPYIEAGAGANLISRNSIKDREFGGSFIFSVMGGAGIEFKAGNRPITVSYRYRHLSNAGLYSPNEGIDSHYLIVSIGL